MARKPRIEFAGAFYHVITRGNQRQKIFRDKEDYRRYLDILSNYKRRYHFALYGYVLMSNHVHLLIETKDTPLSKILQGVNQRYTMHFNKRYRTVGHLLQGRYKALLCDKDAYLLSLVKYIHLNPVRAKIAKTAEEYPWSSHRLYIRGDNGERLLDSGQVLRMFSDDSSKARRLYRAFMSEGVTIKQEDIYGSVDQRIVGDERFAEEVKERYDIDLESTKRAKVRTLEEITRGIKELSGVGLGELRRKGKDRRISLARKLCALAAKEYGYKGTEISGFLRKDPAVITRYLQARLELADALGQLMRLLSKANSNRQV
jgi:REP element-mobilizing transposase RayT